MPRIVFFCGMLLLGSGYQSYSQVIGAEVVDYSTICTLQKGDLSISTFLLMKINNKKGLDYADFEVPYKKGEKISIDQAWIMDGRGGVLQKLRAKDIADINATGDALYQDYFYKKFSLRYNVFPYWISLKFTTGAQEFLSICHWTPVYSQGIPVDTARLTVSVPAGYPLKIFQHNIEPYSLNRSAESDIYHWSSDYKKQIPDEIYSPSEDDLEPEVIVIPDKFQYGKQGEFSSWQSFGNWVYRLNEGLNDLPMSEKNILHNLLADKKTDVEKARAIYHYMEDHTRYIEITLNIGGMKPFPASFVAEHKYGDCKALSNYLMSALAFAGIPSYYTLINASRVPDFQLKNFPSQQFNHAILTVPLGKDTVYLENTSSINPFGYLGTMTQNRYALMVSDTGSRLIRIPALTPGEVETSRNSIIRIGDDNTAAAKIHYIFRGRGYELISELGNYENHGDQDALIRKNFTTGNFEVDNWKMEMPGRDSSFVGLALQASGPDFVKNFGPFRMLKYFNLGIPEFELPSIRSLPVFIPYPYKFCDTTTFLFRDSVSYESVPPDTLIESRFGSFSRKSIPGANSLSVYRVLLIRGGNYPLPEYDSLYNFIAACRSEDNRKLLFK